MIAEIRIAATRIWQHKDACPVDGLRLHAQFDRVLPGQRRDAREQRPHGAIDGHADERDDARTGAADLALQHLPTSHVFGRPEIVDPGCRPGNQVGDPVSPLGQPMATLPDSSFAMADSV